MYPIHRTTLPHCYPLTIEEEIVARADSGDAILLVMRTNSHCDRPIGALPLHCCAIGIVVEPPYLGGNTANEFLDDLEVIFEIIGMGELVDILKLDNFF